MRRSLGSDLLSGAISLALGACLVPAGATADSLSTHATQLACPSRLDAGSELPLELTLENRTCTPLNVRVISSLIGNADETAGGVNLVGPIVADPQVALPAATDNLSGACINFQCVGSFLFCNTPADCVCRDVTPGVTVLTTTLPTIVPNAFDGTVATHHVMTQAEGRNSVTSDDCRIAVPEPRLELQIGCALSLLAGGVRRKSRGGRTPGRRIPIEENSS